MRLTGPAVQRIASTSLVVVRWMRRSRVPAKHGNHQYYKGTGGGSMGSFVGYNFVLDPKKVRDYIIPDLAGFNLRPYVAHTTRPELSACAVKTVQDYIDQAVGTSK